MIEFGVNGEMVINIGINGFGRIGRIVFRKCFESSELEVTAINDPAVDTDYICYLIKFDSTHGRFSNNFMFTTNEITIDDTKIKVFHEKLPSTIPWQAARVQYVVEASGMFTNREKASGHLASGSVKRVIVTAPSVDIPMMILGVNEEQINPEQKVISCASSTLYCLAPLVKVLEENYGIAEGFITSIHAMTPSLKPLDGVCLRGKHWRDHRSILQNIIPAATGACKALGRIIPTVKNKMTGLAFRVPIVNVSVLDVTIRLNNSTTIEDVIKCVEKECQSTLKNIMNTSSEEVVSSDFLGDMNSCTLDKNSSLQLSPNFFKLICWYENEYSYACRVVDTIMYSDKCFKFEHLFNIRNNQFMRNKLLLETNVPFFEEQILFTPSYKKQNKNSVLSLSQYNDFRKKQLNTTQARRICECIHSGRAGDKHKNEIFEIWNDDAKDRQPKPRENAQINKLGHSCVTISPPNEKPRVSKESKPDKDKAEFAKITHKTNSLNESIEQENKVNLSEDTIKCTEDINYNRTLKSSPMTSDNIPCDNNFYTPDIKSTLEIKYSHSSVSLSKVDLDLIESKLGTENANKQTEENKSNKNNIVDNEIIENNTDLTYSDIESHKLLTGNNRPEYKNIQILEYVTNIEYSEIPSSNVNNLKPIDNNDNESNEIHDKKAENYSNNLIGIGPNEASLKSHENPLNEDKNDKIDTQTENDQILNMKKHLQKKILASIVQSLSSETILIGNELSSLPAISTNTNPSNADRLGNLSDIYDKLDSVSGTDSENSFQMKERKSQVLKITDLTASLEDLARLDKICKIIEISDELSDKLFSVLDTDNTNLRRKNWSFKDLCERLKLDEFYNNVFGQSKF